MKHNVYKLLIGTPAFTFVVLLIGTVFYVWSSSAIGRFRCSVDDVCMFYMCVPTILIYLLTGIGLFYLYTLQISVSTAP